MLYLSQLLGASVADQHNVHLGKITDLLTLASQVGRNGATYLTVILVASEEDQHWRVPCSALEKYGRMWCLRSPSEQFAVPAQLQEDAIPKGPVRQEEVSLAHEVLDKQVIDLKHKKAVRVNDVCFGDDSQHSIGRELTDHTQIQVVPTIRTPSGHLAELHPADIATIIHQLTAEQGARVIERLDDEIAADTMEEIDTERQILILENIQPERATHILEAMEPDEAADLLAQVPEEQKQHFLQQMDPEDSEDLQELLEYEDDTAGGLMTTDYIVLNQTRTVQEALAAIRTNIQENKHGYPYIYCVADETEDESYPLGVVTLWDLLVAEPSQTLQDLMETDLITVQPDTNPRTVAEIMAKYNLLAVPVVSVEGILEGVVTVDDALDVLLPRDRRRKPRRMY